MSEDTDTNAARPPTSVDPFRPSDVPTYRRLIASLGRSALATARALRDIRTWGPLVIGLMRRLGVDSIPIAIFIAIFTGIVLALLASYTFTGTVPLYFVGTLVTKSVLMELGPVLTGMALAGRVGANVAAELGTMKVTEQVDALETLSYNPNAYLVVPRVVAAILMFPVVTAIAEAVGVFSGALTSLMILDVSLTDFTKGARLVYKSKDIWYGLVKAASFGGAVALFGAIQGLRTRGGAEGVGRATTKAVVLGCMAILVLDAFWALVLL
jgi:phospholipid/cholesterol/gamma-HCH transport system permease protein